MTPGDDIGADEGGEAPCFAHLLDEPEPALDGEGGEAPCFAHLLDQPEPALDGAGPAPRVARSEGDCGAGSVSGRGGREAGRDADGSAPPGA